MYTINKRKKFNDFFFGRNYEKTPVFDNDVFVCDSQCDSITNEQYDNRPYGYLKKIFKKLQYACTRLKHDNKRPHIEWLGIHAGTFTMGSPAGELGRSDHETQHQVTLSAFNMSKYAITFEQYDAFCDEIGFEKPDDEGWGRGKRPVINVSWYDATNFALWMGCRLPTEAQWEYACRAGTNTRFNTGNNLTTDQANYNNSFDKTTSVGSFPPNAWGLYDMHGNVWEWCSDWYDYCDYPTSAQTNPSGPTRRVERVRRGGSWDNLLNSCRSANRNHSTPEERNNRIGFRIVSLK